MPSPRKPGGPVVVPPSAVYWGLQLCYVDEKGKNRRQVMKGDPLDDGSVPERWMAGEFSERLVLESWGEGRYRVDFFDAQGHHVPESGRIFEVAQPSKPSSASAKKRKRPREDLVEDDETDDGMGGVLRRARRGESFTIFDMLQMQRIDAAAAREREERAAERARAEAQQQRENDRQFMATIIAAVGGGGGGGGQFSAQSLDLLRRELALEMREGMSGMRRDLARDLQNLPLGAGDDDDDDDGDDRDPPKDIPDAANRIAMSMLGEIEAQAPNLLNEAIPAISGWMKSKGFMPSPRLEQQIAEHQAAQRNGRPAGSA